MLIIIMYILYYYVSFKLLLIDKFISMSSLISSTQSENELNNVLSEITSNLNESNKEEQYERLRQLIKTNITQLSSINFIIRNISSYITLDNLYGFELLKIVIISLSSNQKLPDYLSLLLTTLQDNINPTDIKNMNNIINSYELIITELNQKEFTSTLDILNEFVLSNMKDVSNTNKLIGIKTQQNLIIRYYSFKKIKTNFLQGTWDTILNCLDQEEYNYKKELLENIDLLIDKTREEFSDFAGMTLYKSLDFLIEKDEDVKFTSINIIWKLTEYCINSIIHLKDQIKNFLNVSINTEDDKVKNICKEILKNLDAAKVDENSLKESYTKLEDMIKSSEENENDIQQSSIKDISELPLKMSDFSPMQSQTKLNEQKVEDIKKEEQNTPVIDKPVVVSRNIENKKKNEVKNNTLPKTLEQKIISNNTTNKKKRNSKPKQIETQYASQEETKQKRNNIVMSTISNKESVPTQKNKSDLYYTQKDINKISSEYESQISSLISTMKSMSDKQLYLLDVISNLQKTSTEQITKLTDRISQLESTISSLSVKKKMISHENTSPNSIIRNALCSNNEKIIIEKISSLTVSQIKEIDVDVIEDILLRICTIVTKGEYVHEIILFIKTIVISSKKFNQLRSVIKRNLKDVLEYLSNEESKGIVIKDEDLIDISLLISVLNQQ